METLLPFLLHLFSGPAKHITRGPELPIYLLSSQHRQNYTCMQVEKKSRCWHFRTKLGQCDFSFLNCYFDPSKMSWVPNVIFISPRLPPSLRIHLHLVCDSFSRIPSTTLPRLSHRLFSLRGQGRVYLVRSGRIWYFTVLFCRFILIIVARKKDFTTRNFSIPLFVFC